MSVEIMNHLDSEVKPVIIPADAAVALYEDDIFIGVPCHDAGLHPRWCWCPGCLEEAMRREDAATQREFRPHPAEAATDCRMPTTEFTPAQLAAIAILDALDDEHDGIDDFPPIREGWKPEHTWRPDR